MLVDDAHYSIFPTEAEMRGRVSLDAPVKRSSSYAAMPRTNDVNLHRMKSLSSLPESVLGLHRELALEPEPSTAGALLGASSEGELRAACPVLYHKALRKAYSEDIGDDMLKGR